MDLEYQFPKGTLLVWTDKYWVFIGEFPGGPARLGLHSSTIGGPNMILGSKPQGVAKKKKKERNQHWVFITPGQSKTLALDRKCLLGPWSPCARGRVPCCHFTRVRLFATPWTAAHLAPLSVGFSRQECWSGLPFPSPGGLSQPGIEAVALPSPALADRFFTSRAPWEALRVGISSELTVTVS